MSSEPTAGINAAVQLARASEYERLNSSFLKLGRALEAWEIQALEQMGNRCKDWNQLLVEDKFRPESYCNNLFVGVNYLGLQEGTIEIGGKSFECRVENSSFSGCHIESDVSIRQVSWMEGVLVQGGAKCWEINRFEHVNPNWNESFELAVGSEVHGRILKVFPEMDPGQAEKMLGNAEDKPEVDAHEWAFSVVSTQVEIEGVYKIENCYFGPGTKVIGAHELIELTCLSDVEEPIKIGVGVSVRSAILQWSCKLDRGAQLEKAFLFEHSSVDQQGMVSESCIGSNSHIAKGEITACFVGPFVGMHHQSLLIGVLWPEGKGNIGYGANVGSNHTGRAPDQEFWAAEGEFFGLSSSIKFPAYHRGAAYSIVATGVTLSPSKIELPFSLVMPALDRPEGVNADLELIPAWMLLHNRYSLVRSAWKTRHRNKSKRYQFESNYLNLKTILSVIEGLKILEDLGSKPIYDKSHFPLMPGLFMRRENVVKGIEAYKEALELYFGTADLENPDVMSLLSKANYLQVNMQRLAELKQKEVDLAISSLEKDRKRGREITPDYDLYHPEAESDACIMELKRSL